MSDVSYAGPLENWLAQAPPPPQQPGPDYTLMLRQYLPQAEAQDAAEAAAARVRAPYARANARVSGLPDIGTYFGNKLASALTAPRDALYGNLQVTDPETGMPTREAMERGQSVANMGMTGAVPFARQGAAGIFGGRLAKTADQAALAKAEGMAKAGHSPTGIWSETGWFQGADGKWRFEIPDNAASFRGEPNPDEPPDPLASIRAGAQKASQDYTKSHLPGPKNILDRAWDNYTKRMTEPEALQSEAVWGTAARLAKEKGISEPAAFARVMNDWYKRSGLTKRMSEETANIHMGGQRADAQLQDILRSRPSQ